MASALYLLLLHFLYRDHRSVQSLVPSVGTDANLGPEETVILTEIVQVRASGGW
jgi:hypothetical protein